VRELLWGTFGKGGAEHCAGTCPLHRLRWKRLTDCDTEHLQAILLTQQIPLHYTEAIHAILEERGVEPNAFSFEAYSEFYWTVSRALRQREGNVQNN
jgi:hypothetical protein